MAKTVTVDMNIGEPDLTLKNAKKAFDKHTALGAGSPLAGFANMAVFGTRVDDATLMRKNADEQRIIFEEKYGDASKLAGTGKGQNKNSIGTIYYGVVQVRGILLVKHRGSEEALENYGFNVVITQTGARRNVRVDIPYDSTPDMIKLGKKIVDRHTLLGVGSPLTGNIDMTAFGTLVTDAAAFLAAWEIAKDLAQELNNDAIMIIGYGAGQTKDTVGTIYYDRCSMRDRLLQVYQDREEHLQAFGFDVVISEHKAGGGGGTAGAPQPVSVAGTLNSFVATNIPESQIPENFTQATFAATLSRMRYYGSTSPAGLPNPADPVIDVEAGTQVTKTKAQLIAELGINDTKKYLNVQNIGPVPGGYNATFS